MRARLSDSYTGVKMERVVWPAIIVSEGVDELQFIESGENWRSGLSGTSCVSGDLLVDSCGETYQLQIDGLVHSKAAPTLILHRSLEPHEVLELVKKHYAVCGQCCVSKMGAPSVAAAIQLVGALDE